MKYNIDSIYVAGAGNFGREVMVLAKNVWPLVAFLDDIKQGCEHISSYTHRDGDAVIVAIANPHARMQVSDTLAQKGAVLIGIIDRSIVSYDGVDGALRNGGNIIAMPFALISTNVRTGRGLIMNTHSSIGHDCVLGEYCTLASHVAIAGNVRIGNRVEFGAGAIVCPDVTIGDDAFIGAGSVVMRNVQAGERVAGNPARTIGGNHLNAG